MLVRVFPLYLTFHNKIILQYSSLKFCMSNSMRTQKSYGDKWQQKEIKSQEQILH